MEHTRVLTHEERMIIMIAMEMAQSFMKEGNSDVYSQFILDSPNRYKSYLREGSYYLHNSLTNLIDDMDPDKK